GQYKPRQDGKNGHYGKYGRQFHRGSSENLDGSVAEPEGVAGVDWRVNPVSLSGDRSLIPLDSARKNPYFSAQRGRYAMAMTLEEFSTITAKGQTTIPKSVRQALGVDYGGKIAFRVDEHGVSVRRADVEHEDPVIDSFL